MPPLHHLVAHPAAVLGAWSNFYVIVGGAAGALTGLMFVVITLVAGGRSNTTHDAVSAFSTPTVVHFCVALLSSAVLVAPWHSLVHVSVILGATGCYGIFYSVHVMRTTNRLSVYQPGIDDWIWYVLAPFVAYVAVTGGAVLLVFVPALAMFALAGATLLLVFLGIHNAWDVVTYIAVDQARQNVPSNEIAEPAAGATAQTGPPAADGPPTDAADDAKLPSSPSVHEA